jgi:hypothetical protein
LVIFFLHIFLRLVRLVLKQALEREAKLPDLFSTVVIFTRFVTPNFEPGERTQNLIGLFV